MMRFLSILATLVMIQAKHHHHLSDNSTAYSGPNPGAWKRLTDASGWSPRAGGSLFWNGQFTLFGVGIYDQDEGAAEEVWSSSDGQRFTVVNQKMACTTVYSSQDTMDVNGVFYRIQGSDNAHNEYKSVCRSDSGGKSWIDQSTQPGAKPLQGTRYLGAAVSLKSRPETLLIYGGQNGNSTNLLSDVWRSTDSGVSWNYVTDAAFGGVAIHTALSTTTKYEGESLDVIYSIGGYKGTSDKTGVPYYSNDIWISTSASGTIGRKWVKFPLSAPWAERGDALITMSSTGVMVMHGGVGWTAKEAGVIFNDVWASLDGGYSWGLCTPGASYSDRFNSYVSMDGDGFLWVMGGRDDTGARLSDVWRTQMSYLDDRAVAMECNLLLRECGSGLRCLPSSPGFRYGSWGVTCDACPS